MRFCFLLLPISVVLLIVCSSFSYSRMHGLPHCECSTTAAMLPMYLSPCGRKLGSFHCRGNRVRLLSRFRRSHACGRRWIRLILRNTRMHFWTTENELSDCECSRNSEMHLTHANQMHRRFTAQPSTQLISCICKIESGCNRAIGCQWDRGSDSCGPYQIKEAYWLDASKKAGKKLGGTWKNCTTGPDNMACSETAVLNYLARYGQYCVGRSRLPTDEDYARIHNGGPQGCKKDSTLAYWSKIKACLKRFE